MADKRLHDAVQALDDAAATTAALLRLIDHMEARHPDNVCCALILLEHLPGEASGDKT